jgi:hypothetical protein
MSAVTSILGVSRKQISSFSHQALSFTVARTHTRIFFLMIGGVKLCQCSTSRSLGMRMHALWELLISGKLCLQSFSHLRVASPPKQRRAFLNHAASRAAVGVEGCLPDCSCWRQMN